MTPLQFEAAYGPLWSELEAALAPPARKAAPAEPERLCALYRASCEHLALARARDYPAPLAQRLEALTRRAHATIYRAGGGSVAQRLGALWRREIPRAVRRQRAYVLVAALVFGLPLLATGIATWLDPGFVLTLHDPPTVHSFEQMYGARAEAIGRTRDAGDDWTMFGYYIRNNIGIAFQCFAGGIFLGLGSLFFLAYNGAFAGSLAGYLSAVGLGSTFFSFVVTHGAFELTAIVLSGAAGLRLGHALLAPGRRSRRAALEAAAAESALLLYAVIALLLVAAGVEAFWSSARWVAPAVKVGIGTGCWLLVLLYFGRQGGGAQEPGHAG